MKELNFKTNFWLQDFDKKGPTLTEYNLRNVMHRATVNDENMLGRRGLKLQGSHPKVYISEPFIYFEDDSGLFAVHYSMHSKYGKITYYEWNKCCWVKFENVNED
jgi:hypothetical protein